MREILVVGLSWRTAPVSLREKLAFTDDEVLEALAALRQSDDIDEAIILSTCNRVEIYAATPRSAPESARQRAAATVRSYLSQTHSVDSEKLSEALFEHGADAAVRHIFRVASSLDSMVVGESQILGQLKDAFGRAVRVGAAHGTLSRCIERSFRVAKRVRSETEIAKGAANVSSVAVELAVRVFGDLIGKSVLLLGAGKMGSLAARHLRSAGASQIVVANRSPEKARELAAVVEGTARSWDDLAELLVAADVVISSTGSREPILTKKTVKKALKVRRYEPQVIVDIAVPRDVEDAVGDLDGVFLFDVDHLESYVAENLRLRAKEAEAAEAVVSGELTEFEKWTRTQTVVPTIRSLRQHFSQVAAAEAEKAAISIAREASEEKRAEMARQLGDRIAKKLLHAPMTALRTAEVSEIDGFVELTRELFGLLDDDAEPSAEPAAHEALEPSPKKVD